MATDSCLTEEVGDKHCFYAGDVQKIYRLKDKSLLGMSGDADAQAVMNLLEDDSIPDHKMTDALASLTGYECSCLLVRQSGQMFWVSTEEDSAAFTPFSDEFAAVGSGKQFAYGAMEFGATALEAVVAASRRDSFTRGPFIEVHLALTPRLKRGR
jgi:20S proteasome alpha/beta subunit